MDTDGSGLTQLKSDTAFIGRTARSPDGRSIAWRENASVRIMAEDGPGRRELEEVPRPAGVTASSPDGSAIAVTADPCVWHICEWWA